MLPVRPNRIDQVVHSLGSRDAVGVHVLHLRDLLRDLGYRSDIWCCGAFPEVRAECRLLDELSLTARRDTWWLYHLSHGSRAAGMLAARPEPLVVDYHNITPAAYLEGWVPWAAESSVEGRDQLAALAGRTLLAVAHSAYSEGELVAAGYRATAVAPPLFDLGASPPDPAWLAARHDERRSGGADWLFVGRLAPNKAQHDLIKALASYRRLHDPMARLHLVGAPLGDSYPRALERFAARLGLGDAVRFPGSVSDAELAAYYASTDVFVCASEHEGFGIPLVEAMHAGLPVVACDAGAVAGTVGIGALLVTDKSPVALAAAVHRVLDDAALRGRLVTAGRRRAAAFELAGGRARWEDTLGAALAEAGSARRLAGWR